MEHAAKASLAKARPAGRPARVELLVVELINRLLDADPQTVDARIQEVLTRLGQACGLDRTFLFRVRPDGTHYNSHEWVAEGVQPLHAEMQSLRPEGHPLWHAAFNAGRSVAVQSRAEVPEDSAERQFMAKIGIHAALMVPLMDGARLIGVLGYDSQTEERAWDEDELFLLTSVARAVASVVLRAEASAAEAAALAHLAATLRALPDLVVEICPGGHIAACHSDKLPWLSALVHAGIGRHVRDVMPYPLSEALSELVQTPAGARSIRTRRVGVSTLVAPHWYDVSVAPLPMPPDGSAPGVVAVIRDLSGSQTSSEMASYREGQFTAFFEMCPQPILLNDYDTGEILDANRAFKTTFGLDPQASPDLQVLSILPDDVDWFVKLAIAELRAKGSYGPVEASLRRADGSRFPAVLRGFMSIDPNGRRLVWALIEDVTDLRAQEAALLAEREALQATRRRFLSAIEALDDGFAIFDAQDRLVLWNTPYVRVFGGIADLIREGALYDDLLRAAIERGVFGAEGERDEVALRRRLDRPLTEVWDGEDELADGRLIWVRERATPAAETVGLYEDVTARRLADRRLQQVMEGGEVAVWDWDDEQGLSAMNDRWRAMLGQSDSPLGPMELLALVHRGDLAAVHEAWRALAEDGAEQFDLVCRLRHGSGRWVWLLARGRVLARRADGTPRRISGVTLDISARTEAERKLSRVIDGAQLGIWEHDIPQGRTLVNDRWAEILGYRAAELNPLPRDRWLAMIHPDDAADMLMREAQAFASGIWTIQHEMRLRHRDGHWVWILSRGQVIDWDWSGQPLQITGVHIDVSAAKRLEAELARERDTLARIMETSVSGIIAVDATGKVVFVNGAAEQVLGRPVAPGDDLMALMCEAKVTDLDGVAVPPDRLPFSQALAGTTGLHDLRHAIRWPCGTRRVVSVNAARLSAPGTGLAVVCSFTDITAAVENEDRLRTAMTAAETANRAKSDFLAAMSHEIRTPLNGVLGMAHVLDLHLSDPDQRGMLQVIRESGEHLLGVINDILDLAKIEAGRLTLVPRPLMLCQVVSRIVQLHALKASEKGVKLVTRCVGGAEGEVRMGDEQRIIQILHNLLGNAVKFTDQGEIVLEVDATSSERTVVVVRDTGIGMAEAELSRVLEEFTQGQGGNSARHGGTGLGLAIVRRLARLMQGDITLQSRPGEGVTARVDIALPVLPDARAAAPQRTVPEVPPMRVLAAEDNATNRIILHSMLKTLGVTADIVHSGDAMLERWDQGYDALLLDIAMPGRGGIETLERLQEEAQARGMTLPPALAVTANAMTHQIETYLAQGFTACVAKPIALDRLAQALIHCRAAVV
ncbi:PAS domain S-box protein [Tabrizicola aquatica]|uniref:PAS domain S-box protein n=1 Tax=Tabrizicola aquatica TaxID=909926 RepID=UPI000CD0C8D6|nr:PAS domain S-box protein [Tabrizicola aquatica]